MAALIAPLLLASVAVAQSSTLLAPAIDECPRGGAYLVTVPNVLGACAVTFDGSSILVCAPEQVADGVERQVVRAVAVAGKPVPEAVALPSGASMAVDVDVAADGTVAIADAAGAIRLIAADGTMSEPVGAGVLDRPTGVAWLGSRLAVSDAGLGAVVILDPASGEVGRIGGGRLREPAGLDVASDGTLFVADRLAHCVWRIEQAAAGRSDAPCVAIGERGSNPGQFLAPADVAVREVGGNLCIVVADELNHRVQVLDRDGRFVGFFGMHALIPRQGEGRIHYPRSVAVDASGGTLAVAEAFEDRVQLFRLKGDPDEVDPSANRGAEFITSHFGSEVSCAADLLALVDTESQAVALLDARTTPPIHMSIIGGLGAMPMRFGEVSALGIDPTNARVWVADRMRERIDVFQVAWDRDKPSVVDLFMPSLARSVDLVAFMRRLAPTASAPALRAPRIVDIEFNPAAGEVLGEVLLLDQANRAIIRTDRRMSGGTVERLPSEAREPVELAVATDGRVAVTDPVRRKVYLRGADGAWSTIDRLADVAFGRPAGVGFLTDGGLVVSDGAQDRCIVEPRGGQVRTVGERGVLDEQFFDPQAIAASPLGVIVVDKGNHRFQRFAALGADPFAWNLTGSMGRYYDRKRRGSPGAAPASTPESRGSGGAS